MNSTLQAKLHYDGKPHQKKVSMFLNQSVKKLKTENSGQVSSTTESDWNTYCEVKRNIKSIRIPIQREKKKEKEKSEIDNH